MCSNTKTYYYLFKHGFDYKHLTSSKKPLLTSVDIKISKFKFPHFTNFIGQEEI
jgi:hypothetical protein